MAETYSYYNGTRLPDKVPEGRRNKPETNYGLFALVFLILSAGLWFFGYIMTGQGIMKDGKLSFDGVYLYIALISFMAGFIIWMVSLSLAGAGLASGRGGLGALLTLALTFLPVIFICLAVLTGWIPDALADMTGLNDIGKTEPDITDVSIMPEDNTDWPH